MASVTLVRTISFSIYQKAKYNYSAAIGKAIGEEPLVTIYPIDSAKTHYQRNCLTKAKGQPVTIPRIQFNNASMYRGLGVSMARSCIINTIFFSSFEFWKKKINSLPDPIR
ncbi:MAG: hypothetical protein LQ344_002236 [Seirophora lacunosa]|nr:MAG: hypothetical protein LQ344_002236 [Seirophora lacunosa]